ncbi:minor tail protein [Mycobacterium phage SWU2]|uniref:Minor tail protein n=1 Tax=Mycobacterium phage SWU2 TaxID=2077150 RepID=A0A2K9VHZ8_9CAUD|nr:minor tail protein [Mycobacterium phage SWU2]AUV61986.1 minor tail protein [Mycobacterium phage SWU2]
MQRTDTVVELEDVNGEWWNLTTGDRGVYLGTGVKGIYDPPVKVVYEEPGNYPGSRYLNHRILRRDLVFGVEILDDDGDSWLSRDSEWRKAWAFDRDCKLYITTPESGTRYLKLRLGESIEVDTETDPRGNSINRAAMVCISGDPFWYQDDVVYTAVTQTDTTFNPNPLPWPWPQQALPTETLTIEVDPRDGKGGLNPTDQAIFLKWQVPGSTEAPAEPYVPGIPWLGAPNSPACIWTVPDYSFEDEELANRRLRLPGLIGGLRTEEVQAVFFSGKPTSGTFKLGFDGEWTTDLAWNATTANVKAALEALAGIAFNDVQVTRGASTNESQMIRLTGNPNGGTFTLTFNGETTTPLPFNATAGAVRAALIALPSIANNEVNVVVQATDEVQEVRPVGEPTSGTFKLTLDGHTTGPIPWNASAAQVEAALRALPNVSTTGWWIFQYSDVRVTKASGQYQPWVISFKGNLAGRDVPRIVADPTNLSGGAGIDLRVKTVQEGSTSYIVTFGNGLGGFDFDLIEGDGDELEGTGSLGVQVAGIADGSRPYMVTFTGALSGIDVPQMEIDTTELDGLGTISGRVEIVREGKTFPAENAVIDTDPRVEQVTSESGSQLWSRMNGVRFRHPVPPWTKSKTFEITVSGCVPGQMIMLRIPRPWSRPWGLE